MTRRTILRWLHIALGIPVIGYIYTPFDALHDFAWMIRYFFLPALLIVGLWMWKGHVVTRLFNGRQQA